MFSAPAWPTVSPKPKNRPPRSGPARDEGTSGEGGYKKATG
jgi:hypothetical protein